jgi:hypothetical protein
MSATPAQAFAAWCAFLAPTEGGLSLDANDSGNFTPDGRLVGSKFGISAHSYPDVDIPNLTIEQANLLRKVDFWDKVRGDESPTHAEVRKHRDPGAVEPPAVPALRFRPGQEIRQGNPDTKITENCDDPGPSRVPFRESLGRFSQSLTRWPLTIPDRHTGHPGEELDLHHPAGLSQRAHGLLQDPHRGSAP